MFDNVDMFLMKNLIEILNVCYDNIVRVLLKCRKIILL